MKMIKCLLPVIAMGFTTSLAMAATSGGFIDGTNTVVGTVANVFVPDGQGDDWTGAVLRVDLSSGSIYNDPGFDSDGTQAALWGFVPALRWDSAVGIPNDGSAGIAGGAGDLGCVGQSLAGSGACAGSITWFNTAVTDTAAVQTATITLTEDANGTWELITSFAGGQIRQSGVVYGGMIWPEPTSLTLLGLGGVAVLRRR